MAKTEIKETRITRVSGGVDDCIYLTDIFNPAYFGGIRMQLGTNSFTLRVPRLQGKQP